MTDFDLLLNYLNTYDIVSSFLILYYSFSRKILYNLILWVIHMSEKYNKNTLVFVKEPFIKYLEIRI